MKFGLWGRQLRQIQDVLAKYPAIEEAVLFGSRAMGNYKEASDIDIAIKGQFSPSLATELKTKFQDETPLPFFFDVVAYSQIDNPKLKENIDEYGVLIYPTEWKEYELVEVAEKIGSGATPRGGGNVYKDSGIAFIRSQNVNDFGFEYEGLVFIDSEQAAELDNVSVQENDILMNITGESVTRCCVVPKEVLPARVSQHVAIIRPVETKAHYRYVFYYLQSIKDELNSLSEIGGTRRALTKGMIEDLQISLPSIPNQRAIAGVLSSLDDKIDLLHRQNKTLEGMAAALWRKMFVEEAEPGWEVGKLGEEMNINMGQSPPGNTYNEDGNGMIFFQGRAEFGFRFPKARLFCTAPKRFAKRFDTLVSVRAPVGDINMALSECCIGRGVAAVRHKKDFTSYTFYKMKSLKAEFDSFEQQGTVFGSIGKDDFNGIDTTIPDLGIIQKFENVANALDKQIYLNSIQINKLIGLRDMLLPKLISGEVAVKV